MEWYHILVVIILFIILMYIYLRAVSVGRYYADKIVDKRKKR